MKGAMGSVLEVSTYIYQGGEATKLTKQNVEMLNKLNVEYSRKAMRVLAFGYRELKDDKHDYEIGDAERNIIFLGLMAMNDPAKEGVKEAIEDAHEAHIKTFMMTGDYAITAQAIGKQIDLSPENKEAVVITGEELSETRDEKLTRIMEDNQSLIFSRVSPEDKLRIIQVLRSCHPAIQVQKLP